MDCHGEVCWRPYIFGPRRQEPRGTNLLSRLDPRSPHLAKPQAASSRVVLYIAAQTPCRACATAVTDLAWLALRWRQVRLLSSPLPLSFSSASFFLVGFEVRMSDGGGGGGCPTAARALPVASLLLPFPTPLPLLESCYSCSGSARKGYLLVMNPRVAFLFHGSGHISHQSRWRHICCYAHCFFDEQVQMVVGAELLQSE